MRKKWICLSKTNDACVIDGVRYPGIPVFFSAEGVIEPLSGYMIKLVQRDKTPVSTAETYAFQLQKFWKWISDLERSIAWDKVDDNLLIAYRDSGLGSRAKKSMPQSSTVKAALEVIFQFYVWAEASGRLNNHVAIYSERGDRTFRISAVPNRRGRGNLWSWPHLRTLKKKAGHRPTPTDIELECLHDYIYRESKQAGRDSMIARFYEEGALRVSELRGILTTQVPTWSEIEKALAENITFDLKVKGKGDRERHIPILPELMQAAREYCDGERKAVVESNKKRNLAYTDPKALVLSTKTGQAMTRQALSHRLIHLMRGAGMKKLSGHRIRARALSNIVEAEDLVDETGRSMPIEQILMKAQGRAGHLSPEALRPYLNDVRKTKATGGDDVLMRKSRLRTIEIRLHQYESMLKNVQGLATVAQQVHNGALKKAIAALAEYLETLKAAEACRNQ